MSDYVWVLKVLRHAYRPGAVATVLQYVVGTAEITKEVLGLDHYTASLFRVDSFGIHLICIKKTKKQKKKAQEMIISLTHFSDLIFSLMPKDVCHV